MFRSKDKTGLYAMAAEVTATYGGYVQPLRDWIEVYWEYRRRESYGRGWSMQHWSWQYIQDIVRVRRQPLSSEAALIEWTRSDSNVDMLVGGVDQQFIC